MHEEREPSSAVQKRLPNRNLLQTAVLEMRVLDQKEDSVFCLLLVLIGEKPDDIMELFLAQAHARTMSLHVITSREGSS